jgi:hypothetical protein
MKNIIFYNLTLEDSLGHFYNIQFIEAVTQPYSCIKGKKYRFYLLMLNGKFLEEKVELELFLQMFLETIIYFYHTTLYCSISKFIY